MWNYEMFDLPIDGCNSLLYVAAVKLLRRLLKKIANYWESYTVLQASKKSYSVLQIILLNIDIVIFIFPQLCKNIIEFIII